MIRFIAPVLATLLLALPALAAASPISGARQLTFEGARAGEGYFSADGTRMIFQSEREPDNPFYQMYLLDLTTGDVERVSTGIGKTTCGWIHPSGERVLFASTQFDPEAELKMAAERDFRASGQTRRYAWDYDPTYEIVETDLATGTVTRLTDAEGYDAEGAYSPDGRRIVFASNRAAYAADLSEEDAARLERDPSYFMDLYVMDADGSNLRQLTDAPGYDGGPFWSADGTQITWRRFSEDGARAEIYTMRADGTDERRITDLGVMSWAPFFHPSGDYIVFATNLQGFANFELYLVDSEGLREPVRVTDRAGFDGLATFAPGGDRISWTSNATAGGGSQIFLADWDDSAARALLAEAPLRDRAEAPAMGETVAAIREADLRLHVNALASVEMAGRLTGTEGERRATAYVAGAFRALGLAPEGADGFFHPFDFTAGVSLGEGNRLTLSGDGAAEALDLDRAWRPLAFSAQGPLPGGEVVFAGYGLEAPAEGSAAARDSYAGLGVEGKWVLLWRGLPPSLEADERRRLTRFAGLRYKAAVAKARGARGVIFAVPFEEGFDDTLPALSHQSLGRAEIPAVVVNRATGRAMLARLGTDLSEIVEAVDAGEAAGAPIPGLGVAGEIALRFETGTGRNVLGRLDLDGLPAGEGLPPVLIGAHVDHLGRGETAGSLARGDEAGQIHFGADDNASGVAAILEVAQYLAAERAGGRLVGARDIVIAAWSGEELGLLGVNAWVDDRQRAAGADSLAEAISAYVNLDMVGRLEDRLVVSGTASSPVWAREIERRNAVVGLPILISPTPYLPTDATALYSAEVPILSLFTGAHEDYHRPSDTPEKLNYEGLAKIARLVALVAGSRAEDAAEPDYVDVPRESGSGGGRMGSVYLGTIPDYADERVAGVPLSGVVTGGPAEAAGLADGDVVVGLAGEELSDIYDLVRTLNGLRPGETVEITVLRDGERVTLPITPRSRN
ncbi:MAG: M28 family peptidase [Paracoccaceae bacterium]